MNILFVCSNTSGGAGVAALRLFRALKHRGVSVRFLALNTREPDVQPWFASADLAGTSGIRRKVLKAASQVRHYWYEFRSRRRRRGYRPPDGPYWETFTPVEGTVRLDGHPWFSWADVIHLHWVAGFLAPAQPWAGKRWVQSLHDLHPFTGACHFPRGCTAYEQDCSACPLAGSRRVQGEVVRLHRRKAAAWRDAKGVILAAPSQWIHHAAAVSAIAGGIPGQVIPNYFDPAVFTLLDRDSARRSLGLPARGKLALFVAGNVENLRKGVRWFQELCQREESDGDWCFVVVGAGRVPEAGSRIVPLGALNDPRLMALAYNACDAFLSTAEEDNYPSTIAEAQLCGLPVVAFRVGGQPEMVDDRVTGYLADFGSVEGLQEGLRWASSLGEAREAIRGAALRRWNPEMVIDRWLKLYRGERT